ncbi:hypothetical protein FD754_016764 [Muntiacus muntjak]|uniref:Uncharacterized protein n=1 Tax=Muntiacus muntjak TaxID=9888 RepID=A0A5N3VRM7_MUNMU|nr:hypothetical protein FD754_016764 [Muntiacus muntjak]
MESVLPATGFLYWVGAGTVAYLALRIWCLLFTAVRVWGLGNESGVGPRLGEWAGEVSGLRFPVGKNSEDATAHGVTESRRPLKQLSKQAADRLNYSDFTRSLAGEFSQFSR